VPVSCHCFAGLVAPAISVKVAKSIIGYLKTGEVFTRVPDEEHFASVIEAIGRRTLGRKNEGLLRTAYYQTRTIEPPRYVNMVTLLESFAAQLSQHAESLAVIDEGSVPRSLPATALASFTNSMASRLFDHWSPRDSFNTRHLGIRVRVVASENKPPRPIKIQIRPNGS